MKDVDVGSREKKAGTEGHVSQKTSPLWTARTQEINQGKSATGSCKLTSPIGLQQSRAIGGQASSLVDGSHRATRSGQRRVGVRSEVAVQIYRVAGSAFSEIRCSADDAAELQTAEDTAVSKRCGPVGTVSCAVAGIMSARSELVGAKL